MGSFKKTFIAFAFLSYLYSFNICAKEYVLTMEHSLTQSEYDSVLDEMGKEAKLLRHTNPVKEVVFVLRNTEKKLIGTLVAFEFHGSLMVDILFIDKQNRLKGYGSKLIATAVKYAKKTGLDFVTVNTMDFWNAVPFYKSHGFFVEHVSYGYKNNSKMYIMRKNLD